MDALKLEEIFIDKEVEEEEEEEGQIEITCAPITDDQQDSDDADDSLFLSYPGTPETSDDDVFEDPDEGALTVEVEGYLDVSQTPLKLNVLQIEEGFQ